MPRSDTLTAWLLRVFRGLGGARKGDSPIFVGRKSGQSPGRKSGQSRDDKEADILGWLEDGEEIEDEEKYWRKTAGREGAAMPGAKPDKMASVDHETRQETTSDEAGTSGAALTESAAEDRPSPEAKTRLRKALSIGSDVADVVVGFFKSLRATDWLLLGAVLILLVVVTMMLFPATSAWGKAVINVRKWPWWIWTCISLAVLGFLVWLRSRYE